MAAAGEETTKKDNTNDDINGGDIVLKVFMHCEACARKVAKSLKGFPGVEDVMADCIEGLVRVKGRDANPVEVQTRVQEKSRRKVELIAPLPKPTPQIHDDKKEEDNNNEPPSPATILLNIQMHCEACARVIRKKVLKINGVENARTDLSMNQVAVTGIIDPNELVKQLYNRTKKIATVLDVVQQLPPSHDHQPPQENSEKNIISGGELEDQKKAGENADMIRNSSEEISKDHNKEEEEEEDIKKQLEDVRRNYHLMWPTRNYSDHYNNQRHHHFASYAYPPPPPQIFSDENPNACFIM